MTEEKVLIIVNSIYQLLTAIHMKTGILLDVGADLVLTDIVPGREGYGKRLKETGLFDRVLAADTKAFAGKYMVEREGEISKGYEDRRSILRWALSDRLLDYSRIYFSNYDTFTRMLACEYEERDCSFVCYEDGFSTYVIDYLKPDRAAVNRHPQGSRIRKLVKEVLLYEPGLAMRGDELPNHRLPKIQPGDEHLKALLNFVFAYHTPDFRADTLFLEQSFRAEGLKTNDLELMRECREIAGAGHFLVKPHPRNPGNVPYQMGLTAKYREEVPWELFLMNENPRAYTVATVCSNGALTSRIVLGLDVNTVMLYRLYEGQVLWKEDAVLQKYLRKFKDCYAGKNYYVPETLYELRSTLTYLRAGGNYGK